MRTGALPLRNSETSTTTDQIHSTISQKRGQNKRAFFTRQHPVPLWLALISMNAHCWPPEKRTMIRSLRTTQPYWTVAACCSHPSRLILRVRSSQRFLVSTKMMVLFSFSAMISSISWINLQRNICCLSCSISLKVISSQTKKFIYEFVLIKSKTCFIASTFSFLAAHLRIFQHNKCKWMPHLEPFLSHEPANLTS